MFNRLFFASAALILNLLLNCSAAELGSPDFQPTSDAPIGWRGDGTGRFPGANPPVKWGRISETLKGLRNQAAKPKGEDFGDAKPVELGQITEWLVAGPFDVPGEKIKDELDREWVPGEAAVEPDVGVKAGEATWQKATADGEMLYFNKIFPALTNKGVYAHAWLHSQTEGAVLMIAKGTAFHLWLNGAEGCRMDQDASSTMNYKTARLKRGWNRLLLKTIAQRKDNKEACCAPTGTCFFQINLSGADPNEKYEEENILWTAMPPQAGYFSCAQPLVVGGRVIVNADPWFLVCYDKLTGKRLWTTYNGQSECMTADERSKFPDLFKEIDPKANRLKEIAVNFNGTFAERKEMLQLYQDLRKLMKKVDKDRYFGTADRQEAGVAGVTSCSDGKFIYTWYADGIAVCHDLDGNRQWIRLENEGPVGKDGSNDEHGYTTSPILIGDLFVVTMKNAIAHDKKTGEIKWRLSYGGKRFAGAMINYDQANDPAVAGDNGIVSSLFEKVFLVPGKGYFATSKCTLEGNRAIVPMFDPGCLYSVSELPPALSANARISKTTVGLPYGANLENNYDLNTPGTWVGQGTVASPLVYDGHIYSIGVSGVLNVHDFQTLKPAYAKWLGLNTLKGQAYPYPANSGVCASPTLGGKNIYLWGNGGTAFVIKPGPKFEVVAKNHIERVIPGNQNMANYWYGTTEYEGNGVHRECTVSSPIFDGDRIYYQGERYIYCIGKKADAKGK